MLSTFQKVKETVLIFLLNIALPTVDISTDLISIAKLYIGTETHTDCDEERELVGFVNNSNRTVPTFTLWTDGKRKCIGNSPAEGLFYTSSMISRGKSHHLLPLQHAPYMYVGAC